ncbi:MAG: AIR synthase-related protein, partial [Propionibacteriaceae bacterium]|nr:AIR synthase-related protein [Propionibacteriaceae bacterium]
AAEKALATLLVACARESLVSSAHDLAEGGLAVALLEACLQGGHGVRVDLGEGDPTVTLFAESAARALVSVPAPSRSRFLALCEQHGVPVNSLGEVTGEAEIELSGLLDLDFVDLRAVWALPIPAAMG